MPTCTRIAAALTLVLPGLARAQVTLHADLPYGDGHVRQRIDLYIPTAPSARPRPVILWIHGGGWIGGDKAGFAGRASALAARGFASASTNYRLSGDAISPAQIHDCKAAIRFLRAIAATYNIDPLRIGVWGSSAGGHLAAHLGTSGDVADAEGTVGPSDEWSSRVQAAADYFGPTDFFRVEGWHEGPGTPESALLGFTLGDVQDHEFDPAWAPLVALAHLTGVTAHVSPDDPPFHIAHGDADTTVWPEHSELLYADLRAAGVESTLRIVPGAGHGLPQSEDTLVFQFFQRHLGPCPADVNRDGQTDFADYLEFLNFYNDGHWRADFNSDRFVDFADYLAFLNRFEQGC